MEDSIASPRRRWLLVAGVLLVAGALCVEAGRHWLAEHWARSAKPAEWVRAAELQPDNAGNWYRLGQFRQSDFEQTDLNQAIFHYQRATQLNSRSSLYWMGLASAFEMKGEPDRAQQAFEKAKSSYPVSSKVAWRYGNFLLRQGQLTPAFAEIRRSLASDPRLAGFAVGLCWRASQDVERILDEALPPEKGFYLEALRYFASQREINPALTTWNRFLRLNQPFALREALPLLELLIRRGHSEDAEQVWQQATQATGLGQDEPVESSLVWNGGFEGTLAEGGFGWRKPRVGGALFDFDTTTHRSGARSLRVTFDGSANLNFQHLVQYILVEPHSRYHFQVFLRTEAISSDSGMRFRIYDPKHRAALDTLTPGLVGSQAWTLQQTEFTTGPETRLLVIALRRLPSRKFDNKLRGTVWVDDVSLAPVLTFEGREAK
jgi:tetratricopeptide (TPR) repeat protein